MTLVQIASWINQNSRYKMHPGQLVFIIDMVQKMFFDEDSLAFKYDKEELTIYQQLNYDTETVAPDANDVGETATGQTSGITGTVITYDTTNDYIVVETEGAFTAGEQITTPEGMDITLATTDHQEGYKGPYDYPTTVPVRKMMGITKFTDAQVFGVEATYESDNDDYGLVLSLSHDRYFYTKITKDRFARQITFVGEPSSTETYRWIYFRAPLDITDLAAHDSRFYIDTQFQMDFIRACIAAVNVTTEDGKFTRTDIEYFAQPFWQRLRDNWTPMGSYQVVNEPNGP